MKTFFNKLIAVSVSLSLLTPSFAFADPTGNTVATSAGDITRDESTNTGMDRAQNGVPIVNIAEPSGAGVSHNRFADFNVGREGAIMNNSNRIAVSQLGGAIYANPNLNPNGEEARIILNEVTSTRNSRLFGATEIHGRSADYILANPNGITCNGCGFINTPRVILGTGRPDMQNGDFMGLFIDPNGQVSIEGNGIVAGNVDYFDIITRSARINADFYANHASIRTGNDYYNDKTGEITSVVRSFDAPAASIDSSLLGGIYAGRITLESTELGVGVNMGSKLVSHQDLSVTADGRIVYSGAVSQNGSIIMESKNSGIEQTGFAAANDDIKFTSKEDILINGGSGELDALGMYAGQNINLLAWGGPLLSGIEIYTNMTALNKINLTSDQAISNLGAMRAGEGDSGNAPGTKINISASTFNNSAAGKLIANGDAQINASKNINFNGGSVSVSGDINLSATKNIDNNASMRALKKITLAAGEEVSNEGALSSGISGDPANPPTGVLISAKTFNNSDTGKIGSHSDAEINTSNDIRFYGGQVFADGDIRLNAKNISTDAEMEAGKIIDLTASETLENNGSLVTGADLILNADILRNGLSGFMFSDANVNAAAKNGIDFRGGEIDALGDVSLDTKKDIHNAADVQADGKVTLNAERVQNDGSLISGNAGNAGSASVGVRIAADSMGNTGQILSYGDTDLAVKGNADFGGGEIISNGDFIADIGGDASNSAHIEAGNLAVMNVAKSMNNGGTLLAGSGNKSGDPSTGIRINAESFQNGPGGNLLSFGDTTLRTKLGVSLIGGSVITQGGLDIHADGNIFNQSDIQTSRKSFFTAAGKFTNQGSVLSGSAQQLKDPSTGIWIAADSMENSRGGELLSYGDINASTARDTEIKDGNLLAAGDIHLTAKGDIKNTSMIQAENKVTLDANNTFVNEGSVLGGNAAQAADANTGISITADKVQNTSMGKILSYGNNDLSVAQDLSLDGELLAMGDLNLYGLGGIYNSAALHADKSLTISAVNSFTNAGNVSGGNAQDYGNAATGLHVSADSIHNTGAGTLQSYGVSNLNAAHDGEYSGGDVTAVNDLNITGNNIQNSSKLQSEKTVNIGASGTLSNAGTIAGGNAAQAGDNSTGIRIVSDAFNNAADLLSYGKTSLSVNQDLNLSGNIMTYGDLSVSGKRDIINKTAIETGGKTDIQAGGDFYNGYMTGGLSSLKPIVSDDNLSISARNIYNFGSLQTGGDMILNAQNAIYNNRRDSLDGAAGNALILSGGDMILYADRLTNDAGSLLSMKDLMIQKDASGNKSALVENISAYVNGNYTSANIEADRDIRIRANLLNNTGKDHGGYYTVRVNVGPPGNNSWKMIKKDVLVSTLETKPAYLTAGRDIFVDGAAITNYGSVISASRDITFTGGSFSNVQASINVGGLEMVFQNHATWRECRGLFKLFCRNRSADYFSSQFYSDTAYSSFGPELFAGGNILIGGSSGVSNGGPAVRQNKTYNDASLNAIKDTGVIPIGGITVAPAAITGSVASPIAKGLIVTPLLPDAPSVRLNSPISLTDSSIFNLSSLFGLSKDPNSLYVVESRSKFISVDALRGSKYFLNRIGYHPNTDVRLLGDDYFMSKLLEKSIREATGKMYLEQGIGSSFEQMADLYDNAIDESKELSLSAGIALTPDQIAQLKKDIVWLVETEISVNGNPQKVLMPQVYLARTTREGLTSARATIEGENIAIGSEGSVNNLSGRIKAQNELQVAADKNINNIDGLLESKGDMALAAGNDLTNQGGKISAQRDLYMYAKGDIASSNVKRREGMSENWHDVLLARGSIEAGKNATLSAGKDLKILGTSLSSGEDLAMKADGDIVVNSEVLESYFHASEKGKHSKDIVKSSRANELASIKAGGSVNTQSGRDTLIAGGNVEAGEDLSLVSGGKITVSAVQDDEYVRTQSSKEGVFSSSSKDTMNESVTNQRSTLRAGGALATASQADTNLIGVTMDSKEAMNLESKGALTIASVQDRTYSYSHETKKGIFSKTEDIHEQSSIRQRASDLSSGSDYQSVSLNDTNIVGSNISAAGNGTVLAGSYIDKDGKIINNKDAKVNVISATDSDSVYDYHRESHMDLGAVALGTVTGFVMGGPMGMYSGFKTGAHAERGQIDSLKTYDTHEQASTLNFGGNAAVISAGDTNIISSKINSGGNAQILAGRGLDANGNLAQINDEAALLIGAKEEIHRKAEMHNEIRPDYAGIAVAATAGAVAADIGSGIGGVTAGPAGSIAGGIMTADYVDSASKYIVNKQKKDTLDSEKTELASSEISSGGKLDLEGQKQLTLSASNLISGSDMSLKSAGDILITSGEQKSYEDQKHSEISFDNVDLKFNRSSVDLNWSQKGTEKEKTTEKTTQKQTQIVAGGNLTVDSGKNTDIVSSNLLANKKTSIHAGGDVNLKTAEETEKISESESTLKNTFTASAGNSWVETGFQAADAAQDLKEMTSAENSGTTEGSVNTAVSAAKAAIAAYQVAKLAQTVANNAATAATYGFYGEVSMTQEREKKTSTSEKSVELGSSIISKDVDTIADHDLNARGANISAEGGDLLLKAGNNINIESAESRSGSGYETEKESLRTTLLSSRGFVLPTFSMSRSKGSEDQVTQINSQISAREGTVKIESGNDTTLAGVNVKGKNADLNVGGTLTLASKQDRMESKSENESFTLGSQIGFSIGQSKSKENWTNSQSSILGSDSVKIKAHQLDMVGSIIANQKEDGTDGGNLTVDVAKLTYRDLLDSSESSSFNFSIGTGLSGDKDKTGKTQIGWKNGNTNIAFSNGGSEKEGVTHSTLGQGNITVNGDPNGAGDINRDLTKTQIVTQDKKTGGFNVDISISNQFIADVANEGLVDATGKQLAEAKKVLSDLPKNVAKAGERVGEAAKDLGNAITQDQMSIFQYYGKATAVNQATLEFLRDYPELGKILGNNKPASFTEYNTALNAYADYVTKQTGVEIDVKLYAKDDQKYGKSDNESKNIFVNVGNTDVRDTDKTISVFGHEVSHKLIPGESEVSAKLIGDKFVQAWNFENDLNGNSIGKMNIAYGTGMTYKEVYDDFSLLKEGNKLDSKLTNYDSFDIRRIDAKEVGYTVVKGGVIVIAAAAVIVTSEISIPATVLYGLGVGGTAMTVNDIRGIITEKKLLGGEYTDEEYSQLVGSVILSGGLSAGSFVKAANRTATAAETAVSEVELAIAKNSKNGAVLGDMAEDSKALKQISTQMKAVENIAEENSVFKVVPEKYRARVAGSFKGEPKLIVLEEDLYVYQRRSPETLETSPYFSKHYEKIGNAKRFLALPSANTGESEYLYKIPKGSTILQGRASSMVEVEGFGQKAVGGGIQTYLPNPKDAILVKKIK